MYMSKYNPLKIEPKWQKKWDSQKIYKASDKGDKSYILVEFPYPSGDGLHVGHVRSYTALDVVARKRRMEGKNVLYPMGWDAFGLPAESYAVKTGIHPEITTKKNIANFKKQMKSLGLSFDWSREINTTDPKYYKWTQWIFLQFLKAGLAYKAKTEINWCPKDKIGLANEEVIDGKCERCGTPVEKREKEQWMLGITKYADRLDKDLDNVDYPDRVKIQQRNWIGRSEGAEISFKLATGSDKEIKVFTTRPETIFGATFLALSPKLAKELTGKDFDITKDTDRENKEKIGKDTGLKAINPANKEEIPVWVANYVSSDYGTGAIMAVPADDERDMNFAKKFNLPIVKDYQKTGFEDFGKKVVRYKLRDWIFSRQRYWGEPIPLIHCEKCGVVAVPDKDLPVKLPKVKKYTYTDTGESPLANVEKWVNVKCPKCGGKARRETDTMPNWAGSSWYFYRYGDPKNTKAFADAKKLKYWQPVDWYNGGMEHTTLHLLYSRFWNKFLYDQKLVPTSEPYAKRTSHGLILAEDGEKMSKSRGNVVNPEDVVKVHGADTLRLYEMFMGPFEQNVTWSTDGIVGPRRFLERIFGLSEKVYKKIENQKINILEKTIEKVTSDIETMNFNTAISQLMICSNALEKEEKISQENFARFLQILAPFAPHATEELWQKIGMKNSIHKSEWPKEKEVSKDTETNVAVQINGKTRGVIRVKNNENEENVRKIVEESTSIKKYITGQIKKVIYVPGKVINFII